MKYKDKDFRSIVGKKFVIDAKDFKLNQRNRS